MIFNSKDLLINHKQTPDEDSQEFNIFWALERKKCQEGIFIDGTFINGFLYWHCNLWTIISDHITKGRVRQKPFFRDSEWLLTNKIWEAKYWKDEDGNIRPKGVIAAGTRRFSKSEIEASFCAWEAICWRNAQVVVSGLNEPDVKIITDKIDLGINELPNYFMKSKVEDNWKKQVTLGIKDKVTGQRIPWSSFAIRNFDNGNNEEALAGLTPSAGVIDEALEENSLIYLEDKVIPIKDVQIGDMIYGADGKLTRVLDKVNPGIVDLYEITFSDGRKVKASENHLWTVFNTNTKKWETLTTEEIERKYYYEKYDSRYNKSYKSLVYSIPINKVIEYQEKVLKIEPYYLGLWLGDGFSESVNVCSIDDETINYCEEYARTLGLQSTISWDQDRGNGKFRDINIHNKWKRFNPLRDAFKEYNLFKNKHIPQKYLYGSFKQRLELLRGLMDTDGSCDKSGHLEFGTSFPQLAKDFEFLCRSLGISLYYEECYKTYNYKGEKLTGKKHWRFHLYTDLDIFKLQRKRDNYKRTDNKKQKAYLERITIANIEYVGESQAYCLKVDNKDHLFITGNFIVTHNCGKGPFLKALLAGLPGLSTPNGWRGTFILTGTGGDMDSFKDFQTVFDDPDSFNFLSVKIPEENRKCGVFLPGWMSYSYPKEKTNLAKHLGLDENITPNLDKVEILVSDKEKNEAIIDKERDTKRKSSDGSALLKHTMYFPKNTREIFLSGGNNRFNIPALKQHQEWLKNHYNPIYIDLYRDVKNIVQWSYSDLKPIDVFPVGPLSNKLAPVCIYELPIEDVPFGTYCIGIDPINTDDSSETVVSLASVRVYKRMISPLDEFKNQTVASWAGRFKTLEEFHELALRIAEFYNAKKGVIPEASENTLIQYFFHKKKGIYLADSFEMLKELSAGKFKGNQAKKGLPATPMYQKHYMNLLVEASNEEEIIVDEEGNEIQILGLTKILDPMLIQEMIEYKSKASGQGVHDGNYDRVISEGVAQTLARHYDIVYPIAEFKPKQKTLDELFTQKKEIKTMFGSISIGNNTPFGEKMPTRGTRFTRGIY